VTNISVKERLPDVAGGLDLGPNALQEQHVALANRRARQAAERGPYHEAFAPRYDFIHGFVVYKCHVRRHTAWL